MDMSEDHTSSVGRSFFGRLLGGGVWIPILAVLILIGVQLRMNRHADTPSMFNPAVTLEQAQNRAAESDKVVFALATADWCGPCQALKRGALSDQRVVSWAAENAETVYIDVDKRPDDAQRLGVRGIPALYVIRGDAIVAETFGVHSAGDLLDWLETSARR